MIPVRKKLSYDDFVNAKSQLGGNSGFKPTFMPDFLFPFQKALLEWSVLKGRSATMADCGLGKTPIQLFWAQNVVEKTNKPVLILTPYMGVGSEVFGAVINNRLGIGFELKATYYKQSCKNLAKSKEFTYEPELIK
jgi:hypothetical protein